ncbi:MAG: tetratricopeptide repeat protein [Pseudomonadota bacterium]
MTETFKVFLSSTGGDLDSWRDAVAAALWRKDGVEVIRMEDFVATGLPPIALCLEKVAACQIFVGLIGFRYGSAIPGRVTSFTQAEYEEAVRLGLPCLMYVAPTDGDLDIDHGEEAELRGRLDRLRARVMRANTAGRPEAWANADALALHVVEALQQEIERQRAASAPGFTREKYGARIKGRLEQIAELMAAEDAERDQLANEKTELERRLSDLDSAFADAQARIQELEALLTREGNHLGFERLERAEKALEGGDFDAADALLAEIEDDEELAIKRAARAAFGRGKIAEERVRWQDARTHFVRAASLDPTKDHLNYAAQINWQLGDYAGAERLARQGLTVAQSEANREHEALWLTSIALYIRLQGRLEEAEPLFRQAIEIDKATIGEGHPSYATRLNNLAKLFQDMGRLEEAAPMYAQSLTIFQQALGDDHPNTKHVARNRAKFLRQHFPDDPAIAELEEIFGPDIGREEG